MRRSDSMGRRLGDAIAALAESFASESGQIGRVLVKRIETEEASLYSLYPDNSITTTAERDRADLARMSRRQAAASPGPRSALLD